MNNFICKCQKVLLQEDFITTTSLNEKLNKMPKGSTFGLQVSCPDCNTLVTIGEWDGRMEWKGTILTEG